jgi:hypothetical protein
VAGLAFPVEIDSAAVAIDGARVALDRLRLRAGALNASGEYRYEPAAARVHQFRLVADNAAGADLESLLAPALRRRGGLLTRALRFGRAPLPDWLAQLRAEGSIAFGVFSLGGVDLHRVRARVTWDGTQVALDRVEAALGESRIQGAAAINLRGRSPSYRFHGKWRGVSWQSGSMEAEGIVAASGMGVELLENLRSSGIFQGKSVALPEAADEAAVRGAYELEWTAAGPRVRFAGLHLTLGEDHYTGRGHTTADGRLVIDLTSGARELRMSGTLARLAPETIPAP